jgi:hypothetical protein
MGELTLLHQPKACAPPDSSNVSTDHTACVPIRQATIEGAWSRHTRISAIRPLEHAALLRNLPYLFCTWHCVVGCSVEARFRIKRRHRRPISGAALRDSATVCDWARLRRWSVRLCTCGCSDRSCRPHRSTTKAGGRNLRRPLGKRLRRAASSDSDTSLHAIDSTTSRQRMLLDVSP